MQDQITSKWPGVYYDDAAIDNLSLSSSDKTTFEKILVLFMQWYSKKTGKELPTLKATTLENEEFSRLKNELNQEYNKTRDIFTIIEENFKLTLTVPSGYYLKESNYGFSDLGGG